MELYRVCAIFVGITVMATLSAANSEMAHSEPPPDPSKMLHDMFNAEEIKNLTEAAQKVGNDGMQVMQDTIAVMMQKAKEVNVSDIIDSLNFTAKLRSGSATLQQVPETVKKYFKGAETEMNEMMDFFKNPKPDSAPAVIKNAINTGKEKLMGMLGMGDHKDNHTPKEHDGDHDGDHDGIGKLSASFFVVCFAIAIGFRAL